MTCPCEPSVFDAVPCDTLSRLKQPSEAFDDNDSATPPKQSRAAKRQQRLKRAILKTITFEEEITPQHLKAPPGLEDEPRLDIAANVDTAHLAKRVERYS